MKAHLHEGKGYVCLLVLTPMPNAVPRTWNIGKYTLYLKYKNKTYLNLKYRHNPSKS